MTTEMLRELLNRRPFEPFEVRLSSGEVHEVKHPEVALLTKTRMVVAYPETDRIAIIALLHIASVEVLRSAA